MHRQENLKGKSNRGITLIALVITIIVLLILAEISIAMLTGENGILTKADTATRETEIAEAKEQAKLEIAKWTADRLENEENANINDNIIQEILKGKEYVGSVGEDKFTTKKSGYEIFYSDLYKNNSIGDETENKPPIPEGFYVVPGLDDIENGFVISDVQNDTADGGNQFVWIPVAKEDDYQRINFGSIKPYWKDSKEWEAYFNSLKDDEKYLPEEINSEKEAVLATGGFYVGRYEAGKEEGNEEPVSKKEATVWNNISPTETKEKAKTFRKNMNVKSALISGIQWDRVMQFINGKLDGEGNTYDVTTYSPTRHLESRLASGQNKADKVCNIYDLEGNYVEYIAEKNTHYGNETFVSRGGYNVSNCQYPAYDRHHDKDVPNQNNSFRLVLYV